MPTPRVFVVRVIRRTGSTDVHGVVEHASSRKRVTFRSADGLWRAVAGSAAASRRLAPGDGSHGSPLVSPSRTDALLESTNPMSIGGTNHDEEP